MQVGGGEDLVEPVNITVEVALAASLDQQRGRLRRWPPI
jgi:hypothetical protein